MPIEAVIFDMDGVLVDSEFIGINLASISRATAAKCGPTNSSVWRWGRSTVGWAQVMRDKFCSWKESIDEIIAEMKARVIAHYEERMPTRPGALESVANLKAHFRVGLASGSPTEIIKAVMRITRARPGLRSDDLW